eukprot:TRINITY_DN5597_c0_g1_i1.p2 TRINITY_DN5597_c0_g1~~TRINITY_DN5597_c0_g1_i1.p2  ORF type:complete len:126 (+),score=5.57 TRINITY_DN5597_c0_g1_i1:135-512(+)
MLRQLEVNHTDDVELVMCTDDSLVPKIDIPSESECLGSETLPHFIRCKAAECLSKQVGTFKSVRELEMESQDSKRMVYSQGEVYYGGWKDGSWHGFGYSLNLSFSSGHTAFSCSQVATDTKALGT